MDPRQAARLGWQIKAVCDESYLYIRIESRAALPAPGSTIESHPVATFDEPDRANSHRAFAAYTIRLERNDREVFSASADLHPSPLIEVAGRDYDIRIPLATMGILDSRATRMTIGDAQWPKSAVVSAAVQRYPR